jgi:hypothetical protein
VWEQWKRNMFKCLCVVQGGYNMCIRFNQKFMFCTDHGICTFKFLLWWASALGNFHFTTRCFRDFHFSCTFWNFHFTVRHCGISILPPAGRIYVIFQRFNRGRKLNFRCRCDENVIPRESCFNFDYRLPLCLSFRFIRLYSTYKCNENFEWLMQLSFEVKLIQQRTIL